MRLKNVISVKCSLMQNCNCEVYGQSYCLTASELPGFDGCIFSNKMMDFDGFKKIYNKYVFCEVVKPGKFSFFPLFIESIFTH